MSLIVGVGVGSTMAEGIAQTLQRLSSRGVTVIASMHCPSSTIAQHFGTVLLLTPDGRTAYHGPYGQVLQHRILVKIGVAEAQVGIYIAHVDGIVCLRPGPDVLDNAPD